ncbi:MAG: PqqD family protein [Bacteroidales bacterium]|nr:PqqD family protein [Bacteroidales bacterium]MDD2425570.1 PqqD family protein [Bacteroidales bacterium]MDD3989426.1 PqqD family protein [Bacteroidales bacterium]MDD4638258.1 PqqD family protein [Bacteroidales bacterium]
MRILHGCKIRDVAGDKVVIIKGKEGMDLTRVVMLNKSAELLFEKLRLKDFSHKEAAEILMEEYGIEKEQSMKDSENWIASMKDAGLITE